MVRSKPSEESHANDGAAADAVACANRRIFVGGLGEAVNAHDLESIFSSLGEVVNVEIVRNVDRSFAFFDFTPTSDKALAKLFSSYNGCSWKGGKLRLERAKEHYLSRLKREWAEDAAIHAMTDKRDAEKIDDSEKPGKLDLDGKISVFFPKSKKIKLLPLKGTGKHKYSFQRIEVPTFPVHFCDCEEHSGSTEAATQEYFSAMNAVAYEKEIDLMNSVMNKLFEKSSDDPKSCSSQVLELDRNVSDALTYKNDGQVNDVEEGYGDDKDDLVINIMAVNNDPFSMKVKGESGEIINEERSHIKQNSSGETTLKKKQNYGPRTATAVRNDAAAIESVESHHDKFSSSLSRSALSHDPEDSKTFASKSTNDANNSELPVAAGTSWMQKSSWRDLVGPSIGPSFSISNILPSADLRSPKRRKSIAKEAKAASTVSKKDATTFIREESKSKLSADVFTDKDAMQQPNRGRKDYVVTGTGGAASGKGSTESCSQEAQKTIPEIRISEVCPFMRTADSQKEWERTRKALSRYSKKNTAKNATSTSK